MFIRGTKDINLYLKKTSLLEYLDETNLNTKSKWYIRKIIKKIDNKKLLISFKHWILWRWVNNNFMVTEKFSAQLKKNIKKLNIVINSKEEAFINQIDELIFNSWRPLKEVPVKFKLDKNEKINLVQSSVDVHLIETKNTKEKLKMIGKFDAFFSNKNLFLTDSNQIVKKIINYEDVIEIIQKSYGLIMQVNKQKILLRGRNRMLTYVLLQRIVPKLNLDINNIKNLYSYFEIWNTAYKWFN